MTLVGAPDTARAALSDDPVVALRQAADRTRTARAWGYASLTVATYAEMGQRVIFKIVRVSRCFDPFLFSP